MEDRLEKLIREIRRLEGEVWTEIQKKQAEFFYEIQEKSVRFGEDVRRQHKMLATRLYRYVLNASFLNILTAPLIWFCVIPAFFMDLVVSLYQMVCFPVYGIPKVSRDEYFILDRHSLRYLNGIERLNCYYCGYFNGLISYVQEIAARTEQYWCPIKHARKIRTIHSRYRIFFDYGDAETYRRRFDEVRRDFDDLQKPGQDHPG